MKYFPWRIRIVLLCLFAAPALADTVTYPTEPLDIRTPHGTLHFTAEVATSDAQHEQGLMFRKTLADLHAMIFIFPKARPVTFWMKNTLIPLDMLFIDDKGVITQIVPNAPPESLDPIPSQKDTRAVIETGGGTAAHYHIAPGDKVIYSLFQ